MRSSKGSKLIVSMEELSPVMFCSLVKSMRSVTAGAGGSVRAGAAGGGRRGVRCALCFL